MNERTEFTFPLANLLWMLLPLAVIFGAFSGNWSSTGMVLVLGVPAAIGALYNGRRGMWRAMLTVFDWFLLAIFIGVMIGFGVALIRALEHFLLRK